MNDIAKMLIAAGAILVLAGIILLAVGKFPGAGRLPGDILIKRENFTFFFPLTTSIIISVILSIVLLFLNKK